MGKQSQFNGAEGSTVRDVHGFFFIHLNAQDKFTLQQMANLSTNMQYYSSKQPHHLQQIYDLRIVSSILSQLIYSKCDHIHPSTIGLSPEIKANKNSKEKIPPTSEHNQWRQPIRGQNRAGLSNEKQWDPW